MVHGHGASLGRADRVRAAPAHRAVACLSGRQREVLELLGEGVTAREIAARLDLAEPTVRNHIRGVLRKLGCHSQLEAVAVAFRLDLIRREVREHPVTGGRDHTTDAVQP